MSLEEARAITKAETSGSWALWFGVLGSPLAWAAHLVAGYSLEEWFACSPSAGEPGEILDLSVDTVAILVNSVLTLVAAASLLTALACRRRLPPANGDAAVARARFMALAGVIEGALFVPAVLFGFAPPFLLGTCEVAP